jgi:NAD(P)-dependent dehydrogenase (short-subunit alcohol dehydrogenase family)
MGRRPRRTSKAALNAITIAFAVDLESTRIKVNAAAPGFTATDLNNFEGTHRPRGRA